MPFIKNGLIKFNGINEKDDFTLIELKETLKDLFNKINFQDVKNDLLPFIKNDDKYIESLNKDIYLATIDLLH